MSIKTNAEQIKDETITGANTATRVGGNLVEIADDLIAKQIDIDLNTAKVSFTNALVDANNNVTANTAKVGITTGQASAIIANTSKVSFDSTSSNRLANTSGANTGDQDLSGKQDLLISATNIKTINGSTLLGSGNILTNDNTVNLTGDQTIAGTKTFSSDSKINNLTIGRGGGNITTNTVFGIAALQNNSTGTGNFALGETSLFLNQTGFDNIAIGSAAIRSNISGIRNIGIGNGSLLATTGSANTGIGRNTITSNTTGGNNIAIGNSAGHLIGSGATGATILNSSIFIGNETRALFDNQTNQIVIGPNAIGLGSNTTVLGNSSTVFGRFWGRLLVATSSDNGIDQGQFLGSVICTTLKTSGFTVSTLPTPPAQGLGARAHVTDALNPTYLGTLTGGGTVKCPVFYNGTAWVSA